ncbi:MAG: hypothetical protein IT228_12050 [Flavobacteriales bacterium]|nr:hypothetical protein [Flavobacteriales bacterium]MCC6578065.1 hypothetical protein [Flavobacteriales bacterium]NUQ16207.1 hypothetical protein [Flavobacteriales bacterium]
MDLRSAFAVGMSGFYILTGLVIGLTPFASDVLPHYRTALAAVLVGYGLLRLGLWWRKRRRDPAA